MDYDDPDTEMREQPIVEDKEIDSDEAFGEGDEVKYEGSAFLGNRISKRRLLEQSANEASDIEVSASGEKGETSEEGDLEEVGTRASEGNFVSPDAGSDDDVEMSGASSSDSGGTSPSLNDGLNPPTNQPSNRALLRKMMADSQATLLSNLTNAAKVEAAKGKAIKHQRSTFDSLLNTRIKLQKALVATNSLQASLPPSVSSEQDQAAILAAEQAALNLWNTLDSLLTTLQALSSTDSSKPPPAATPSTPVSTLQSRTLAPTTNRLPHYRSTRSKWSQNINPPPLPSRNKFSQTPSQQPLTTVLDQHLSGTNATKLLAKTRVPRSCAPVQAAEGLSSAEDIFDDADFYTLLLRELVDQRMASSRSNINGVISTPALLPGMKDKSLRVKKKVDTKASKGRKMRYTVHEKLQNFMAPEDRGTWSERQRKELFAGLLGRRVEVANGEGDGVSGRESDEDVREEEGLRLFRR